MESQKKIKLLLINNYLGFTKFLIYSELQWSNLDYRIDQEMT